MRCSSHDLSPLFLIIFVFLRRMTGARELGQPAASAVKQFLWRIAPD
jgi:hypothetical protein